MTDEEKKRLINTDDSETSFSSISKLGPAESTKTTRADTNSSIQEDIFRLIERGDSDTLKRLVDQVMKGQNGGSVFNSSSSSTGSFTGIHCMRQDRLFSALVFACFTNQLKCFEILYEHGKLLTQSDHATFVKQWIGGESEQRECLKHAVDHDNGDLLHYLLTKVQLSERVKDKESAQLLFTAAKNGNERIIFELAGDEPGYGADVNATDADGNSALHFAATANQASAARFLLSLGARLNAQNNDGQSPLHAAVIASNLRTTKDLLLRGAERKISDRQGRQPKDFLDRVDNSQLRKSFKSALSSPWYYGCPLGRIPLMSVARNNRGNVLFCILFFYIVITQIVVLQPVMNVYYFMISTSLISIKLFAAWYFGMRASPGYVERDNASQEDNERKDQLQFANLVKQLPGKKLCPYCKVIKPPRSRHCQLCNKCTDRYETHCVWLNNCVGRGNSNYHMIFVFYVWLDVFLLGWISMTMIGITHCDDEHLHYDTPCYYRALCVGCNNLYVHYIVAWGDMIICFFFMIVTTWPMIRTWINYCKNETSYEGFVRSARKKQPQNALSDLDSMTSFDQAEQLLAANHEDDFESLAGKHRMSMGCRLNCKEMCCNRQVLSQQRLLEIYLAEAASSKKD